MSLCQDCLIETAEHVLENMLHAVKLLRSGYSVPGLDVVYGARGLSVGLGMAGRALSDQIGHTSSIVIRLATGNPPTQVNWEVIPMKPCD